MRSLIIQYDRDSGRIFASDPPSASINDNNALEIVVENLPTENVTEAQILYDVRVRSEDGTTFFPYSVLTDGRTRVNAAVLSACNSGRLPISLKIRYSDQSIECSVNQIAIKVSTAPDGEQELIKRFPEEIMTRSKPWEWLESWMYDKGSLVLYNWKLYVSLIKNNLGNVPDSSEYWWNIAGSGTPDVPEEPDVPIIPDDPEISEYAVYFTDESGNSGLILADGEPVLYEVI